MARARAGTAAALVATLCVDGSLTGMSDEQLLERFVSQQGETAELVFGALVQRHGPMVLAVCRGVLRNQHDADDAFQATFLVLARKAPSLRTPGRLGPWLHGVARRSAQKLSARRSRVDRLVRRAETNVRQAATAEPDHGHRLPGGDQSAARRNWPVARQIPVADNSLPSRGPDPARGRGRARLAHRHRRSPIDASPRTPARPAHPARIGARALGLAAARHAARATVVFTGAQSRQRGLEFCRQEWHECDGDRVYDQRNGN